MIVLKRKIEKDTGWSPARRAQQSARMRAARIWLKSTGPRTPEGKRRASANSLKIGVFTREGREVMGLVRIALRAQRVFLRNLNLALRLGPQAGAGFHAMVLRQGDQATALLVLAEHRVSVWTGYGFSGQTL